MMMWEESIPSEMQSKIWFRHAALVRKEGYWIQVKGEKEDRAKIWLELISQTHKMDSMLENDKYKIIHFSLK